MNIKVGDIVEFDGWYDSSTPMKLIGKVTGYGFEVGCLHAVKIFAGESCPDLVSRRWSRHDRKRFAQTFYRDARNLKVIRRYR